METEVATRSALLSVSLAALSGVAQDGLIHGALQQLRDVTACDVAAFYTVSKADGALALREQLRGDGSIEALPAEHPHVAYAADGGGPGPRKRSVEDESDTRCDVTVVVRTGNKTYGVLAAGSAREQASRSHRRFVRELADVLALSLRAERRQTAAELLFKRSRYVFDRNPNPMMILDAATLRFVDVNQTAIDAYGYTRAQWLTMTPYDLRPAGRIAEVAEKIATLERDGPTTIDTVHRRADGSRLDAHLTSITVERDGGTVHMISVVDVTARNDALAHARQSATSLDDDAEQRLRLDGRLRKALATGGFRLDYQPIYELDGTLCASEALIRWPQPDGTVVQPDDFVPYAEASGLIVPIGAWALRSACFRNAGWSRLAPPLRVTVNVSAKQLADADFVRTVRAALSESGMCAKLLELELTETTISADVERTAAVVRDLRGLGIRFSVDDFGTGYNSLATLRSFVVDTLKLDMCFVNDIATNAVDQAIAAAVIGAAHRLGATVVAEGVETADQRAMLAALGCDAAQGFLYGRPMRARSFRELLRAGSWKRGDEQPATARVRVAGRLASSTS